MSVDAYRDERAGMQARIDALNRECAAMENRAVLAEVRLSDERLRRRTSAVGRFVRRAAATLIGALAALAIVDPAPAPQRPIMARDSQLHERVEDLRFELTRAIQIVRYDLRQVCGEESP